MFPSPQRKETIDAINTRRHNRGQQSIPFQLTYMCDEDWNEQYDGFIQILINMIGTPIGRSSS